MSWEKEYRKMMVEGREEFEAEQKAFKKLQKEWKREYKEKNKTVFRYMENHDMFREVSEDELAEIKNDPETIVVEAKGRGELVYLTYRANGAAPSFDDVDLDEIVINGDERKLDDVIAPKLPGWATYGGALRIKK